MYEERVARGATLLDERVPDWATRVDVKSLDVWNLENCVLGQLFGHYRSDAAHATLGIFGGDEYASHGFQLTDDEYVSRDDYGALTELWCAAIAERVSAA